MASVIMGGTLTHVANDRQVPFSDWELRPEDVSICKRANGEDWQIGSGAFGQVRSGMGL